MNLNFNNINLKTTGLPEQFPKDTLPQIAFSGRSNVGKSSLINALIGRKSLARVSSAPGKTITVNFYGIDKKLYIVDLPGYGYAKRDDSERRRWSGLVDSYLTKSPSLMGVVQLIDMKVGPTTDDITMLDWLIKMEIPHIIVATKSDKLNKTEYEKMLNALKTHPYIGEDIPIIPFSALKPTAKEKIWSEIFSMCKM
ncbi:MAG: YihA family ribosome biogenesis GTP-binding protein [Ruminococcaceae bacterium]|nr:YihA family ribosome biogenesis GTP-binding protein [Oscillospiraceae bacterium]